jgi:hypothetical protein
VALVVTDLGEPAVEVLIHRSYNPSHLERVIKKYKDIIGELDAGAWLQAGHVMYIHKGSVGLARKEYPGVYTVHWFFKVGGREAINLAKGMLKRLFKDTDAKTVRGLTKADLKPARWCARQVGMKSYGVLNVNDVDYELFILRKDEM